MNFFPSSGARGQPEFLAREWAVAAGVSLLVAIAVVSPFFFLGTASGHDIAFHMASWLDAAGQWKQGIWLPRWTEWANFGYGEPRFVFYPPLSWLLGALLGKIVPWSAVAAVFVVGAQTLAGLSAFALLRRILDSEWSAVFGAACFAVNPYALLIVYVRSDFAELLAVALFPLVFLGAFRLCDFLVDSKAPLDFRRVVSFAVPFCAVWLSNAPAAVITTYGAAFLFVFAAIDRRSLGPLWKGSAGMLLGFALAGFYLIPAIYEQRWVHISGALAGGLRPAENFLYATTADAEHDAFNRVASNVAVLLLVWVVATAVVAYRGGRRQKAPVPPRLFRSLCFLSAAVLLLMLPLTSPAWSYLPELRFVQFPWRWMAMLAVCAILFTAATAGEKRRWIPVAAVALLTFACGRYLVKHTWWDTEDMPTLEAAIASGEGFEGTDEYDPEGDDHTDLPQKRLEAWFISGHTHDAEHNGDRIFLDRWTAEHRVLRVTSRTTARVAIRLVDYPAWRVTVNGAPAPREHPAGTAQLMVAVPPGESRIEIKFTRTADRRIGGWLSVLTACGSLGVLIWRRRSPAGAGQEA
jgi:hypothetical protein